MVWPYFVPDVVTPEHPNNQQDDNKVHGPKKVLQDRKDHFDDLELPGLLQIYDLIDLSPQFVVLDTPTPLRMHFEVLVYTIVLFNQVAAGAVLAVERVHALRPIVGTSQEAVVRDSLHHLSLL